MSLQTLKIESKFDFFLIAISESEDKKEEETKEEEKADEKAEGKNILEFNAFI